MSTTRACVRAPVANAPEQRRLADLARTLDEHDAVLPRNRIAEFDVRCAHNVKLRPERDRPTDRLQLLRRCGKRRHGRSLRSARNFGEQRWASGWAVGPRLVLRTTFQPGVKLHFQPQILQVNQQVLGALVALLAIFRQRLAHDPLEFGGQLPRKALERRAGRD